jgi:hypothetical protein
MEAAAALLIFGNICRANASNCDYVSDKVQYFDVSKINASGPVYIGKAPLPKNIQGVFWLKDDGGDSLVSFGAPLGGDDNAECSNGKLTPKGKSFCTRVSNVQGRGWTYQDVATPAGPFGGKFPSAADKFYRTCGMKWEFCFDSEANPTTWTGSALSSRGLPCVNVFAMASTTGVYKGAMYGGEYWKVTTKALGIVPMPSWLPGNFEMIQVMDGNGNRILPAWDNFAKVNKQIVYYDDAGATHSMLPEVVV